MSIHIEKIEQRSFSAWEDLNHYVQEEEEKYRRIPFEEFFTHGAKFTEGRFFGTKGQWMIFNEDGMSAFCKLLRIPYHYLEKITETSLVSNVLNSYIANPLVKATLSNYQILLDEQNMTVSNLVNKSYVPYSNLTFLKNITQLFPEIMFNYSFAESYIINTNLYLRLLSPKYQTGIMGNSGFNDDISTIGLQLFNGMTGKTPIKASYFVYRSEGSNGLVLPCTHVSGIVKQTGKPNTFLNRMYKNIAPVIKNASNVPKQIETLGTIHFNLEKLVELDGAKFVFAIIPLSCCEQAERNQLHGDEKSEFERRKIETYIDTYSLIYSERTFDSGYRDHQSMYDFISLFTEYAQTQKPRERIKIEEKSGELANWILQNQSKFEKLPEPSELVLQVD